MIAWGGFGGSIVNPGGRYDPVTDSWRPMSVLGAPLGRTLHTAVWTGSEMIIWGGNDNAHFLATGGQYDPVADAWTPTSTQGAPSERIHHTAVWTGKMMMVWGGRVGRPLATGGRYILIANEPPVADAGPDQTIECTGSGQATAVLDGTGSTDPDSAPGRTTTSSASSGPRARRNSPPARFCLSRSRWGLIPSR